jgi:6-pyruvoyltetrahydropterin/6-carboxytetrahydropterin synthase
VTSMYELKIITHMACAHQLREFEGRCENLHGHNWKIEVQVTGKELEANGILIDFKRIKTATEKVIDELDHKFLNDLDYFKELNPSSENIARYIFQALGHALDGKTLRVSRVTAWESDTACASYMEP